MGDSLEAIDYKQLFRQSHGASIIFHIDDPHFTIAEQDANHAAITFTKPDDIIGKPTLEVFPDNSEKYKQTGVSELIESLRRVIKTGKPDVMPVINYDLIDKKGKAIEKWWRVTHSPVLNIQGKITHVAQSTEDITDQIVAKQKFDLATSQLDSALSIGLVSTWFWDITHDLVVGDKNLAKNFGVSASEAARGLPIDTMIKAIHTDDRAAVSQAIQDSIENDTAYEQEYRTIAKDGSLHWVIARGKVKRDNTGKPLYFIGANVDITERKKAQSRLEQTTGMFNALFESNVICIVLADINGNVLQANKKFLKTFGYTKADLKKGLNSTDLTPKTSRPLTKRIYETLRTKGEIEAVEKDYIRKDGTTLPILVGAAMLPESDELLLSYMLDISENKQLKVLNSAKDEFIALASHQLRTPATAVKQYLGILLDGYGGNLSSEQQRYLNIANRSNERQLTIINDLLKTAQLDTERYALNTKVHDINQLLREVLEHFEPIFVTRQQQVTFHASGALKVAVDSDEIKLALTNLVENASKYTPSGKRITISTQRVKSNAIIKIQDEGVGIAKKDQQSIFDKFTRVDNTLSDTVDGSGLGLYWVKRIVDLHGGTIEVLSQPNKGSTFVLQLPL